MKYIFKIVLIVLSINIAHLLFNHFMTQASQIHDLQQLSKQEIVYLNKVVEIFSPVKLGDIMFDGANRSKNCIVKYNLNLKAQEMGSHAAVYQLCKFYFEYATYNYEVVDKKLYEKGKALFFKNVNSMSKRELLDIYAYLLYIDTSISPKIIEKLFYITPKEQIEDLASYKIIQFIKSNSYMDKVEKKSLIESLKVSLNSRSSNDAKFLLVAYYFDDFKKYKKELLDLLHKLKKEDIESDIKDELDGMFSLYYILNKEDKKAKEILQKYEEDELDDSLYLLYAYIKLNDDFLHIGSEEIAYKKDFSYSFNLKYYKYIPLEIRKEHLKYLSEEVITKKMIMTPWENQRYKEKKEQQKFFIKEYEKLLRTKEENRVFRTKQLSNVFDKDFSYESNKSIGNGIFEMYDTNGSIIFKSELQNYKFTRSTVIDPKEILSISPYLPLLEYYDKREIYKLLTGNSLINLYLDNSLIVEYLLEKDQTYLEYRQPLLSAIKLNNLKTVEVLMQYGTRLKQKELLITAVQYADVNMVKFFVENGSLTDVISGPDEKSLLHLAATKDLEMVKYFVEHNLIEIDIKDKYGNSALSYAMVNKQLEIYTYLVSKGLKLTKEELPKAVDLNIKNKNYTFLEVILLQMDEASIVEKYKDYIMNNDFRDLDIKVLKKFVKYNVDLDMQTMTRKDNEFEKNKKMNVFELLVSELSFEELKPLLEKQKKLNNTLLLFAFANETQSGKKIIDYFLKKGLSLNDVDVKTMLLSSIRSKNYLNISLNLSTITGRLNHTPMFEKKTWRRDVDLLKKIKPNISKNDIFELALKSLNYAFVKYAISQGIDINIMYQDGTALCIVSKYDMLLSWDQVDLIELLVDNGARLENIDQDGNSLFFTVIHSNSRKVFKILLSTYKIDADYKNKKGQDIVAYFSQIDEYGMHFNKYEEFIEIFKKHTSSSSSIKNSNKKNENVAIDFDNDLFRLVKKYKKLDTEFTNAFQKQLDKGIKLSSRNIDGDTILHYAVRYGDKELVLWLIKNYKLDIKLENYHKKSVREYLNDSFLNLIVNYKELNDNFKNEFIYHGKVLVYLDDKLHRNIQKYGDNELFAWLEQRYNIKSFKYKLNKTINTLLVEVDGSKIDNIKYKDKFSWARLPYDFENTEPKECSHYSYKFSEKNDKLKLKVTHKKTKKSTLFQEQTTGYSFSHDFKENMLCSNNILTTYAGYKIYVYDLDKEINKQFVYKKTINYIDVFSINDTPFFKLNKDKLVYIDNNLEINTLNIDTYDLYVSYDGKYLRSKNGKKTKYFKFLNNKNIVDKKFEDYRNAILNHDEAKIKYMLKRGQNPHITLNGVSPLLMATILKDVKIVALLSKWRADMLSSSSRFGTPLYQALKTGDFELIKALQPNNKNKKTNFIILSKLNSKDKDYSKILNYYFSKDRLTQEEKDKLLNKKIYSNDLVMINFLLKNGAKLDSSRYINENFVYAMRGNNQELIKHMLKFKNLNVNYKYDYSHTFLRIATECNLETVKLLLEHGATVDAVLLKTVKDKKILNYLKSNYTQKGKKDE